MIRSLMKTLMKMDINTNKLIKLLVFSLLFQCSQGFTSFFSSKSYSLTQPKLSRKSLKLFDSQTELPLDFEDAVFRAASKTFESIKAGKMRCRIDFDTTIGDQTYTSLKNSLPMTKNLVTDLSKIMNLSVPPSLNSIEPKEDTEEENAQENKQDTSNGFNIERSVRIFFPDMGAAVLARRDWKMGTFESEVPPCVFTANIQNDDLADTDRLAIILCPQYSETQFVPRILSSCEEKNVPCLLVNPALINMDQGFGVRAREIRKNLLDTFVTSYKLKTLPRGALVREWPGPFTVWVEDATLEDGYKALRSYSQEPTREEVEDLFDELAPLPEEPKNNPVSNTVKGVFGFFQGLSKL